MVLAFVFAARTQGLHSLAKKVLLRTKVLLLPKEDNRGNQNAKQSDKVLSNSFTRHRDHTGVQVQADSAHQFPGRARGQPSCALELHFLTRYRCAPLPPMASVCCRRNANNSSDASTVSAVTLGLCCRFIINPNTLSGYGCSMLVRSAVVARRMRDERTRRRRATRLVRRRCWTQRWR